MNIKIISFQLHRLFTTAAMVHLMLGKEPSNPQTTHQTMTMVNIVYGTLQPQLALRSKSSNLIILLKIILVLSMNMDVI